MTQTVRTGPSPPLTGGIERDLVAGHDRLVGVGVLAVDRDDALARPERADRGPRERREQLGDRRAVGELDLEAVGARHARAGRRTGARGSSPRQC